MTVQQIQDIKNHINANLNVICPNGDTINNNLGNSNFQAIADYFNSSSEQQIWRPDLDPRELNKYLVMTEFQALTVQKQNGWFAMIGGNGVDATSALVRTNFSTIFGSGSATTANLSAAARRFATLFESLYNTADGGFFKTSAYGVVVTYSDIDLAIKS